MKAKMGQSPIINSNPALSAEKGGTVLYSNESGELLLHEWGIKVGDRLPPSIEDLVQRVISRNSPEKIEVKVGERVYLVVFHPLPEQKCVNISGFDISDQRELEEKLWESETQEMSNLELANIIDIKAIQSIMEDFYKLANIPIALIDLKGNVLVGIGWQDICTKFHRAHPEASKNCVQSDMKVFASVLPGEFKLNKCKNNLWDTATPIIVGDQHVGYAFSGQFFFEGELLDYELFRSQARKYGFNEEEYVAALERVPRLSREAVNTCMFFLTTFANMVSQLGYSNTKLSQSLAERDSLVAALRESEKHERDRSNELAVLLDAVPVAVYTSHDPQALQITGNRLSCEWVRVPEGTNFSKSAPEGERPEMFKLFKDGKEIPPENMPSQKAATGIEINDYEMDVISSDGKIRHVLGNARPLRDEQGNLRGSISAFIDITERQKAEEKIQKLANAVESSDDAFVTKSLDGTITSWNKGAEKVYGYLAEEILGKNISILEPDNIKEETKHLIEKIKQGERVHHYEALRRKKDGTIINVSVTLSPVFDASGKLIAISTIGRDITDNKKAEEAVRLSNIYNRSLIEASLDPLVTIGHDGKITDVNNATELVTGYSRRELIGTDFSDYFTEPEKARAGYQQVFTEAEVRDYPLEIQHKDGQITHVLYNASVYRDENGKVIGVFAAARDITRRKQAEEALQESEKRYRMLHESMRDAFAQVSMDGRIIEFNDLYCKMLGYSPEEMLRLTYQELTPERWHAIEDDIVYEQIIPRGYSDVYEKEYRRKDGTIVPVELRTILLRDASGRPNGMWAIVRDISERKNAEEALKKAHETLEKKVKERTSELETAYNSLKESEESLADSQKIAHVGNWDWDIVNEKTYWSDEIYRIGRTTPRDSGLSYNEFLSCVHPCDRSYVDNAIKGAFNGKPLNIDHRIVTADGEERIVHAQGEVIFDENNTPIRMRGIVQDITERKKAEEALANIEIARKKEIHHRIKNNLQVISSLLDLQAEQFRNREDIKDSEVLEAFRESQDRVISMALIHEELYRGGGFETLNFSPYIQELAENLFETYSLGDTRITLSMDLEENLLFDMDTAVPLGMIVNELVSNSLKHAFTGRDKGEIRIELRREEPIEFKGEERENTGFTLKISDNGVGIPELEIENLDSLGMQLVTSLVDQLDGELELERNNGTEFTIKFKVTDKR